MSMLSRIVALLMIGLPSFASLAEPGQGGFHYPRNNTEFAGNLVIDVQAQDSDGINRVYLTFNDSLQPYVLCQQSTCGGNQYRAMTTAINPALSGVQPGLLNLHLWVEDSNTEAQRVASLELGWQPPVISDFLAQRSEDGESIQISWTLNSSLLRYNLYLAAEPGANRYNFKQLDDGRALFAIASSPQEFANLDPHKGYFVRLTGIDGSGESAISSEVFVASDSDEEQPEPNLPPVANDDSYSLFRNQTLSVSASEGVLSNDSDPEGAPLTLNTTPQQGPNHGSLDLQEDGSFVYIPEQGFVGDDSFVYSLSDDKGATDQATVSLEVKAQPDALAGESVDITGVFKYIGLGEDPPGSDKGTGRYRIGNCIQLINTRCSMVGRYMEKTQSGHQPGDQGQYAFTMIYSGVGESPVLARSQQPDSNSVQFFELGDGQFELTLFPDAGGVIRGLYPDQPLADAIGFFAFIKPDEQCQKLPSGVTCNIGQTGKFEDAVLTATLDRLDFTLPGQTWTDTSHPAPQTKDDQYQIGAGQTLDVTSPGVLANDGDASGMPMGDILEIRQQYTSVFGSLVGLAVDEFRQLLYLYPSFGSAIEIIDRQGEAVGSLPVHGEGANDFDLDVVPQAFSLSDTLVQQGNLLMINGETGVTEVYAAEQTQGTLKAQLNTGFGDSHVVGGVYNPVTSTLFLIQDNVPAGDAANRIAEINPQNGDVIQSFNTDTTALNFPVSYGDIGVNYQTGNLYLVSNIHNHMLELDTQGNRIRELLLPSGVSGVSGLATSRNGEVLWMVSTSGSIFELGFANQGRLPVYTAKLLVPPEHGELSLNADGSFSYTPEANFTGQDSFEYQIHNSSGSSSQAVVTIDVQ